MYVNENRKQHLKKLYLSPTTRLIDDIVAYSFLQKFPIHFQSRHHSHQQNRSTPHTAHRTPHTASSSSIVPALLFH
jgi:hypothetical protein